MGMPVVVRTVDGKGRFTVEVKGENVTVGDLMGRISEEHEFKSDGLKLVFKGAVADKSATLKGLGYDEKQSFVVVGKRKKSLTGTADTAAKERKRIREEKEKEEKAKKPKTEEASPPKEEEQQQPPRDEERVRRNRRALNAFSAILDRAQQNQTGQIPLDVLAQVVEHLADGSVLVMPDGDDSDASDLDGSLGDLEVEIGSDSASDEGAEETATTPLTPQDQQAIERLMSLAAVPREVATQAYLSMNKNEEAAANMLFD